MYSTALRMMFAAVALVIGGYLVLEPARRVVGISVLMTGGLMLYGYVRYGTVWLAIRALRSGDLGRAERLVREVKHPERLNSQNRAYYHFLCGALAEGRGDLIAAEAHLRSALDGDLRTTHDRAMVMGALAGLSLRRGGVEEARMLLDAARALPHRPELDAIFEQVESGLSNPGTEPS